MSDRYILIPVLILIVLLSGCSAGRQGSLNRETGSEAQVVRTDSLLLQDLLQASRSKTIDIEHVVFGGCRSDTVYSDTCRKATFSPIHSVTRIAIKEQGVVEAGSAIRSGSIHTSRLLSSDSLQKEHTADISPNKWILGLPLVACLLLLLFVGLKNRKQFLNFIV